MIECPSCRQAFAAGEFLAGCSGYAPASAMANGQCPRCGQVVECRIRAGRIEIGYTYWAGSLHFEALIDARVPGLALDLSGAQPVAVLGGRRYLLG